jgi:hypothetical protein
MRSGPDDLPWQAPGGGVPRVPKRQPRSLGLLWVMLLGPVAGVLTGVAAAILLALEPGRQTWEPFAWALSVALAVSLVVARMLALRLLRGVGGKGRWWRDGG